MSLNKRYAAVFTALTSEKAAKRVERFAPSIADWVPLSIAPAWRSTTHRSFYRIGPVVDKSCLNASLAHPRYKKSEGDDSEGNSSSTTDSKRKQSGIGFDSRTFKEESKVGSSILLV